MQYCDFGKTGVKISRLGFGTMRLPINDDPALKDRTDDLEEAANLVAAGVDAGITYVDAAWGYCGGRCEKAVGMGLAQDRRRDQIVLSTKLPTWLVQEPDDFFRFLDQQLERLQTDHIDFYHLHALNQDRWDNIVRKFKLIDLAEKALDQKMIRHLSFSFHDTPALMKEIIDTDAFSSVLCQYNLLDRTLVEGFEYAHKKGLGVCIMGPVGGGRLAFKEGVFENVSSRWTTPELALKFVLSNPAVSCALSGMGNMEMLADNVRVASDPDPLTPEELAAVEELEAKLNELKTVYCTGCAYCQPCPKEVRIPDIMTSLIYDKVYGMPDAGKLCYSQIGDRFHPGTAADACSQCGLCEKKCPQKLPIRELLKDAHRRFAKGSVLNID
ncbi:MAG: aldo/keto reductase [Lentisphaeria bacterium]|nr:aldo/keto reductase [Lentisphaeria bacterium]